MDASQTITINDLVKQFKDHQKALGLTDARFAARYKEFVGSHKTWNKLKDGSWMGHINPERQLPKLKKFAERIAGARTFDADQFFSNLPYVRQMDAQFELLLASPLDIRGLIDLAPQGVGKSWWASNMIQNNPQSQYFYLRLLSNYRDRNYKLACAISTKLGCTISKNPGDQLDDLIKHAQALGEFVIFLDEAHNGGIELFKLLKDLIDETKIRFVYQGFPTEYDLIVGKTTSAIGESRQTLRRCLQPIHDDYRDGVMAHDIEMFLAGHGLKRNAELKTVAAEIQPLITARFNLTTLASAVRNARAQAEDEETDLTLGLVTQAVQAMCSTAAERRAAALAAAQ